MAFCQGEHGYKWGGDFVIHICWDLFTFHSLPSLGPQIPLTHLANLCFPWSTSNKTGALTQSVASMLTENIGVGFIESLRVCWEVMSITWQCSSTAKPKYKSAGMGVGGWLEDWGGWNLPSSVSISHLPCSLFWHSTFSWFIPNTVDQL